MSQLLIIRHGETPLNVARVLQPASTPLSARGLLQAQALARRLQGQGLAALLSSDLPRARQTADAVALACGLPVIESPLLQERNFGMLRGLAYDSLGFDPLTFDDAPPEGESTAQFKARCDAAWAWLLQQQAAAGGPVAVVSHGLVIRHWLLGGTLTLPKGAQAPAHLANCALSIGTASPPHLLSLLADTSHLVDDAAHQGASLSGG